MLAGGRERILAVPLHAATSSESPQAAACSRASSCDNERDAAAAGAARRDRVPEPAVDAAASRARLARSPAAADLGAAARRRLGGAARSRRPGACGRALRPRTDGERTDYGAFRVETLGASTREAEPSGASAARGNELVRDAEFLNWRYVDTPREYRCFGAYRGCDARRFRGRRARGEARRPGGRSSPISSQPRNGTRVALLRRCARRARSGNRRARLARPAPRTVVPSCAPASSRRTSGSVSSGRRSATRTRRRPCRLALHTRRPRLLLKLVFITQSVDPGPSGARGDGRQGRRARRARGRGRGARRHGGRVGAAGELPRAQPSAPAHALRAARASRRARARACAGLRGGAVVAHMCPIYAVLAAPLVRPLRIPVVLWFAHWREQRAPARRRASCRPRSSRSTGGRSRSPRAKLTAIGHGIDLARFECAPRAARRDAARGRARPLLAVEGARRRRSASVGRARTSQLTVSGPALTRGGARAQARARAARRASSASAIASISRTRSARDAVPALLAEADVLVDNMRAGAPDKVVYEAAATCLPGARVEPGLRRRARSGAPVRRATRPMSWRARCVRSRAPTPKAREAVGGGCARGVEERHGVESWADGVLRAARLA